MYKKSFSIPDALLSLTPTAQWSLIGDDYSGLTWMDESVPQPSMVEITEELARLQEAYDSSEYQRLRAPEYPDFKEYLDGVVKGDQAQIDAYIAACQAVKDKYPKP